MTITQITTPTFEYDGEKYSVFTRRFIDFNDFQNYLERKEKLGKTKLFIHSMFTLPEQTEIWIKYQILL
jgi:hypothetical protein